MKSRAQFIEAAIRAAEKALHLPPGWWGTWREFTSDDGDLIVRFSGVVWTIRGNAGPRSKPVYKVISQHETREGALRKAVRLWRGL